MENQSNAPVSPIALLQRQLADWQTLRITLQDAEQIAYCDRLISLLQEKIVAFS